MDENIQQQTPQQSTPSQPQVTPGPSPVPEPPKTFGWLKWVLIITIVAFLSSGTTYFVLQSQRQTSLPAEVSTKAGPTPTPDPTANWKTLEGPHSTVEEPPYSFQYPEAWISETDTIGDPLKKYLFFESGKLLITKDLQLSDSNPQTVLKGAHIGTFGQSNIFKSNKSFDQNLADFDSNFSSSKLQLVKEERFVLDGQLARKRIEKLGNEGYVNIVFEYPKNKGYMYLTLTSSLNDFGQNQMIFDQILSTFKFLEQTLYTCPSTEWIDCMPKIVPGEGQFENPQCDKDYLAWAKTNCPGFQGATY